MIVHLGGSWMQIVEAAQREAQNDEAWARSVVGAAKGLLATSAISLGVIEHSPSCDSASYRALALDAPFSGVPLSQTMDSGLSFLGVSGFRAFYYPRATVTTHIEIGRAVSPALAERVMDFRRQFGVYDVLGVHAYPDPGVIVSLFAPLDREIRLSRYDRNLLARIALHLETSYRLRHRPEVVKAVLDVDGRVLSRSDDAPPDHVLANHLALRKDSSFDLWPALISGRLSLIERGSGKTRRYLVVENAPASQPFRALSPAEQEVVSQASRGHTTKLIAYALGVSSSAVSTRLASAAMKVGAATRMELVRLAAMLTQDPRARFEDIVLTDAERDVLELLQNGLSNKAIATLRSRSVRTIANQVASLLRKTSSVSRRELLVRPRE